MFARAKYVAGKWPKRVGAHALMELPRLKLAQAMTRVMTTFLSARSLWLLSRPLSASMYTNFALLRVSDSKVNDFGLGLAYLSPDS